VFICPTPGIYRAYAYEEKLASLTDLPIPNGIKFADKREWEWSTKEQTDAFDVLGGPEIPLFKKDPLLTLEKRLVDSFSSSQTLLVSSYSLSKKLLHMLCMYYFAESKYCLRTRLQIWLNLTL